MSLNLSETVLGEVTLLLLGDYGVGKSSLITRIVEQRFVEEHVTTIGVDFRITHLKTEKGNVKIRLWDMAGQEKFRTLIKSYFRSSDAILLVADYSDYKTINGLENWHKYLLESGTYEKGNTKIYALLNKVDAVKNNYKERKMIVKELLKGLKVEKTYDVSAKSNEGVIEAFSEICWNILDKKKEEKNKKRYYSKKKADSTICLTDPDKEKAFDCKESCLLI